MQVSKKLLIIDVAALAYEFELEGLQSRYTQSVFPAVTCNVQASFRTASPPAGHGMVANGLYFRALSRAMFWEQSGKTCRHTFLATKSWRACGPYPFSGTDSQTPRGNHSGMLQQAGKFVRKTMQTNRTGVQTSTILGAVGILESRGMDRKGHLNHTFGSGTRS
jgi:hypothetical protein